MIRNRELTKRDAFELIVSSAGTDRGGPVFNGKGQVIGLFASLPGQNGAFGVPIKYGSMLLGGGRGN